MRKHSPSQGIAPGTPILLVPSGTLDDHDQEYGLIQAKVKEAFSEWPIHWAYSSPRLLQRLPAREREKRSLDRVLEGLRLQGVPGVLAQSLHLICGSEFHRMVKVLSRGSLSWRLGLPLLSHSRDFQDMADLVEELSRAHHDLDRLVLVAHGSLHPAWTAYFTLSSMLENRLGDRVIWATLSPESAKRELLAALNKSGTRTVHLVPFLFSVGSHLRRDLLEGPHSWKRWLEGKGYSVTATSHGLSRYPQVGDIIVRHLRQAVDTP